MRVGNCRVCNSSRLEMFLDLGETALANSFVKPCEVSKKDERKYPLRLVLCADCGLVQIDEEVPPETLFKNYIYVSGTSDLIHRHAHWLAEFFCKRLALSENSLVVEAASNDGTILKAFRRRGVRTLGVEPASNIAAAASSEGVETMCEFFNSDTAWRVTAEKGPAKLFLARHVLAHVAGLHEFVKGIAILLDKDGVAAVEMPYLLPFYNNLEYDTVYHEHLCYFSVNVLTTLFEQFGMELLDVQHVAIHGGSIVVSAQLRGGPRRPDPSVENALETERRAGLGKLSLWKGFAENVHANKSTLLSELRRLKSEGKRVAAYGAPAKGNTLLQYCTIGTDLIEYTVDKNPLKQNLLCPGSHIPVHAPEKLIEDQPDVVLILAWNFAAEIMLQQAAYKKQGGMFLIPIPRPKYLN